MIANTLATLPIIQNVDTQNRAKISGSKDFAKELVQAHNQNRATPTTHNFEEILHSHQLTPKSYTNNLEYDKRNVKNQYSDFAYKKESEKQALLAYNSTLESQMSPKNRPKAQPKDAFAIPQYYSFKSDESSKLNVATQMLQAQRAYSPYALRIS
ncbi:MAG: hypothetical protein U9N42_11520 [Campylobacterota bacterium]|nr:hypothetical protein [Campylobacterota bacterium]